MTQEQLAEHIGITRAQLSKVETGKREYGQQFLERAAVALNCEISDLLDNDPNKPPSILRVWEQVPEQNRDLALRMLNELAKTGTDG
jgi:transcriptional regulator with XRE-family HTH domain